MMSVRDPNMVDSEEYKGFTRVYKSVTRAGAVCVRDPNMVESEDDGAGEYQL
jgi:hypothetical protein